VWLHNAQGSTSCWMCKVRYWRWLFGNDLPISPGSWFDASCLAAESIFLCPIQFKQPGPEAVTVSKKKKQGTAVCPPAAPRSKTLRGDQDVANHLTADRTDSRVSFLAFAIYLSNRDTSAVPKATDTQVHFSWRTLPAKSGLPKTLSLAPFQRVYGDHVGFGPL